MAVGAVGAGAEVPRSVAVAVGAVSSAVVGALAVVPGRLPVAVAVQGVVSRHPAGGSAVRAHPWTRHQRRVLAARAVLRKLRAATAARKIPRLRPPTLVRCPVATILHRAGAPAVPAVNRPGAGPGVTPIRGRFPPTT